MTARRQTEDHFQQQVEQLARFYGWQLIYHTHDSRRSHKGFPDLVLLRPPELIFAELKGAKTRVTPEQRAWIAALQAVSDEVKTVTDIAAAAANVHPSVAVEVYLWRPADFDDLHARLARGRRRVEPLYHDREAA